jgi:uncharacterized membrane protein
MGLHALRLDLDPVGEIGPRLRSVSLDFAVVQFEGQETAVQKYAAARAGSGGDDPWTHELGFVERRHNGRLRLRGTFAGHYLDVDESDRVSQKGAGEGAVTGGLVGALLGPPGIAVGLLVGAVIGSRTGSANDVEPEPRQLADQLRAAVPQDSSAIVLIARAADVDEMLVAVGESAQRVVRQPLAADQAAALEASLSTAPPASPDR